MIYLSLNKKMLSSALAALSVVCCVVSATAVAQSYSSSTPHFTPGAPQYYKVKSGDTYYSIAKRFLRNPAQWAQVWRLPSGASVNQRYPLQAGSMIVLNNATFTLFPEGEQALARRYGEYYGVKTGRNALKLLPVAWARGINEKKLLPSGMIEPFKVEASVIPSYSLNGAPIIVGFSDNRLIGSPGKEVYVRGDIDESIKEWYVYSEGERLVDPDTFKELGRVSRLLGIVRPTKRGAQLYTFNVIGSYMEFVRGARLVPVDKNRAYQDYSYQKPNADIEGRIVGVYDGSVLTSQFRTVIINRGSAHGVKRGDVFNLLSHRVLSYVNETAIDGLPLSGYGRVYIYRVEEGTSFAQIIEGQGEVVIYDYVRPISDDSVGGKEQRVQQKQQPRRRQAPLPFYPQNNSYPPQPIYTQGNYRQ